MSCHQASAGIFFIPYFHLGSRSEINEGNPNTLQLTVEGRADPQGRAQSSIQFQTSNEPGDVSPPEVWGLGAQGTRRGGEMAIIGEARAAVSCRGFGNLPPCFLRSSSSIGDETHEGGQAGSIRIANG